MENVRTEQDIFDVLGQLEKAKEERGRKETAEPLFRYFKDIIEKYKTMPLIAQVLEYQLTQEETLILLLLMWSKLEYWRGGSLDLEYDLDKVSDDKIARVRLVQRILNGSAAIVQKGLVKVESDQSRLSLSDTPIAIMKKAGLVVF